MCSVPSKMIAHKSAKVKGTRRVNSLPSSLILRETGQLIAVGALRDFYVMSCNFYKFS